MSDRVDCSDGNKRSATGGMPCLRHGSSGGNDDGGRCVGHGGGGAARKLCGSCSALEADLRKTKQAEQKLQALLFR